MVRWPGRIPAGRVLNGIVSHNDWFVTLLSAVGVPDIAERLRAGTELGGTTYKVHLDGHDQLAYITGQTDESPREHFFYGSDDGDLTSLRYDNWKFVFKEQRCPGTLQSLGRAVHRSAHPQDLQPAHRPLRAGRHHLEHLLRLAPRPRVSGDPGAGLRVPDAPNVRRVPATAKVRQLQPRPGDRKAAGKRQKRLSLPHTDLTQSPMHRRHCQSVPCNIARRVGRAGGDPTL